MTCPLSPGRGPPGIALADLAGHPRFIAPLADAFAREWPQWAATLTRAQLEAIFAPDPTLLAVLVAFAGEEPAGTIALRRWFADEPMDETPWVRQLYVFPRWRGRGVDRLLGAGLEERARALGFPRLYAATDRIEPLLARRGWETFRRVEHDAQPMAWMQKLVSETNFRSAEIRL